MNNSIHQAFEAIKTCVGAKGYRVSSDARTYSEDWYGDVSTLADLVVLPESTAQVSQIMKLCHAAGIKVTAQGGRTGLVGASTPGRSGPNLVINLQRMNKVRMVDPVGNIVKVDAGIVLEDLRSQMAERNRLFPLNIGSKGSCQVGGNIATNAGGINVLRYGNMRDLVLGVEAVLPDGTIWSNMTGLRKDNRGYDLKHLLIGSEGTLAVITGAVLKLFPLPTSSATAMLGLASVQDALRLLACASDRFGSALVAFELVSHEALEASRRAIGKQAVGLSENAPWYVLIELAGIGTPDEFDSAFETFLSNALEAALVTDGILAKNQPQQHAIWRTREAISDGLHHACRHDISLKTHDLARVLPLLEAAVREIDPTAVIAPFGHMGDGNLHYAVVVGANHEQRAAPDIAKQVKMAVYRIVHENGGSFSAEHGVGRHVAELERFGNPTSCALMAGIKTVIDPKNQMNPGVLFDADVTNQTQKGA